jgi:hypothetical protein
MNPYPDPNSWDKIFEIFLRSKIYIYFSKGLPGRSFKNQEKPPAFQRKKNRISTHFSILSCLRFILPYWRIHGSYGIQIRGREPETGLMG